MKKFAVIFVIAGVFGFGGTWSGKLVDASCKASTDGTDSFTASCTVTPETHLFAIELAGEKVLNLDAAGNEKAANAIKSVQKTHLRATVTGSLDGKFLKVESIEVQ
jgi:hypothetical protein